jgi:hypothetical protein
MYGIARPARRLRCSSKAPLESTHPVDIAAMVLPSRDVDRQIYPSQTTILEGGTKAEMRISKEALFKVVSTRFGRRIVENSIENPHFIFCSSFQTLRLGSIKFSMHALYSLMVQCLLYICDAYTLQ